MDFILLYIFSSESRLANAEPLPHKSYNASPMPLAPFHIPERIISFSPFLATFPSSLFLPSINFPLLASPPHPQLRLLQPSPRLPLSRLPGNPPHLISDLVALERNAMALFLGGPEVWYGEAIFEVGAEIVHPADWEENVHAKL